MKVPDKLKKAIARAAKDAGISVTPEVVELEHPAELKNGDYSTGIALQYAKQEGMAPRVLAEKIVTSLGEVAGVEKIEVAGAGFINFYLTSSALAEALEEARAEDMWGCNATRKGQTIMVEYTDPNPFKEFHIGHLMSNAIGESVARLFEFSGAKVLRANYQGDIGPHVAKSLFILLERGVTDPTIVDLSSAYPEGSRRYDEEPEAKAAIDAINKKIYEKSDSRVNDLYAKGRKLSLEHFEDIYKILGTKFDYYFFESETWSRGLEVVRAHPEVFEESEGAIVFKGEKYGLHTRVFINRLGLPTYEAKDLGLALVKREKAAFDLSFTITAHEQSEYFKVVAMALGLALPEFAGKLLHRSHGMMRLAHTATAEGFAEGKMSSRTGNVITGESLLHDLADAAKVRAAESRAENPETLAQQIAVGAIKYQILKQASHKDIIFDRDRALSLEGDSGPYLQYAHARAKQLSDKAREQNVSSIVDANIEPNDLTRLLQRFPEAVEYAASHNEPHLLTNYLLEFAAAFNRWYANELILDGTPAASHKIAVVDAVRRTLKNGLWLLGIPAPEKM